MPTPVAEISSARFSPSSLLIINFPSISNSSSKLYRRRHPFSGMCGVGCLFRKTQSPIHQKDRFPHLPCGNLPFCTYVLAPAPMFLHLYLLFLRLILQHAQQAPGQDRSTHGQQLGFNPIRPAAGIGFRFFLSALLLAKGLIF